LPLVCHPIKGGDVQQDSRHSIAKSHVREVVAVVEPFPVVPDIVFRRVSNGITRVCRGTYGARASLRLIVDAIARHMLVAGSTPRTILRTIEWCVLNHPTFLTQDRRNIVTGEAYSSMLIELARQSIARVALESPSSASAGDA
jgi:hypothetical protein